MRLSRLELRHFRCFESLDVDLEPVTVLVGANDTGKSTVLEAIDAKDKRVAFIGMVAFLRMNGIAFKPDQDQSTAIILAAAAGEVSEQSLARWIRDNWPRS